MSLLESLKKQSSNPPCCQEPVHGQTRVPAVVKYSFGKLSHFICAGHYKLADISFGKNPSWKREFLGNWVSGSDKKYLLPLGTVAKPEHQLIPQAERINGKGTFIVGGKSAVAQAVEKREAERNKTFYWEPYFVDGDWW